MFCFITHPFSLPLSLEIPRNNVLQRNFNVTLFPYSSNKVYNLLKRESKDIQINWAESEDPYDEINIHNIFGHIFSACGNVYAITKNIDEDVFILNTINTSDMSILESKTITDPTSTIKPSTTHSLYGIGYYNTQLNLVFDNGILVTDTSSSNFKYYNIPSNYIKGDFIGNANHYSPARYQLSEGSTAGSVVIKLLALKPNKYLSSTKLSGKLDTVKDSEGNISKFISVYISDKSNSDNTNKSVALLSNGLILPFKITKTTSGTDFGMHIDYGIVLSDIINITDLDKTCAHFIDENTLILAHIESDSLIKIEKYILQTEENSGYYFKYASYSKEELYWDANLINVDNLNIYITIDNNRYIVSIKDKTDGNVIFQAIEKNKQ